MQSVHCTGSRYRPGRAFSENDHTEHFILIDIAYLGGADNLAVLHYRHAISEMEDVMNVVADQEDTDTFALKLLDQLANLRRFLWPKCGRGLVHDQNACVEEDRPGDGHGLALTARERLDRVLEALESWIESDP